VKILAFRLFTVVLNVLAIGTRALVQKVEIVRGQGRKSCKIVFLGGTPYLLVQTLLLHVVIVKTKRVNLKHSVYCISYIDVTKKCNLPEH